MKGMPPEVQLLVDALTTIADGVDDPDELAQETLDDWDEASIPWTSPRQE